jgi:hypothetical protein
MSTSRKFGKHDDLDNPLLYDYLTMNVEYAEHLTAVPLAAALMIIIPGCLAFKYLAGKCGMFSSQEDTQERNSRKAYLSFDSSEKSDTASKQQNNEERHSRKAYLSIDGP